MGRADARGLGVNLHLYTGDAADQGDTVQRLYEAVFTEPPYMESRQDFDDFAEMWPARARQPGFRLVIASDPHPIGMAFGRTLPADSGWWSGLLDDAPAELVKEWPGRSFGINEIAVLPEHRRRGAARAMHDRLLHDAGVERAVLLVRPEAAAAQAVYARWGYQLVGKVRPYDDAPVYDGMILPLAGRGDQVGS